MEVKIGIQYAPRELVVETDESGELIPLSKELLSAARDLGDTVEAFYVGDGGVRWKNVAITAGAVVGGVLTGGSPVGTVGGAAVGGVIGNQVNKTN